MNHLDLPRKSRESNALRECLYFSVFIILNVGCSRADPPEVYRESQGKAAKFTVEQTDRTLRIAAAFIKLKDGTVLHPTVYYYQLRRGFLFGFDRVEEPGRLWRTFGRDRKLISRSLYLPVSEEIATHILLVRRSFPKEVEKYAQTKTVYIWADWQLFEIDAKDISPEKPLVIPAYEELAKRELTKDQEEQAKDLVQKFEVIEAAAWKRAATPVGATPMDCDAPRKPGTYLQGCAEVIPVSVRLSDPIIRVVRFVRLQDGSVLRPTLKYFRAQKHKNSEENENGFLTLIPGKKWTLDLPRSKEIAEHLLLVRRSFHKDSVPKYVNKTEIDPLEKISGTKTEDVWTDWQLLEIDAKYLKPFVIPAYEELAKHELTEEKKALLKDLVQRYDKVAAAARKRAGTP